MDKAPVGLPHAWREYEGELPGITHTCVCGAAFGARSYKAGKPCTREADRKELRECEACYHAGLAGAMMTWYTCQSCKIEVLHHNTSTPAICLPCSMTGSLCRRCGGPLDAPVQELNRRASDKTAPILSLIKPNHPSKGGPGHGQ